MLTSYPLPRRAGTKRSYDQAIPTVCQECPLHCGLLAYVRDGLIVEVQGVEEHPVSQGRLCARGLACGYRARQPERLRDYRYRPAINQPWQKVNDRQQLFDLLSQRLQRLREQQGAAALGIMCGAGSGLDFYLGALRFASLWGTPKVYQERLPGPALGNLLLTNPTAASHDWPQTQALVIVEADPVRSEPLLGRWLVAARRRGVPVLVADACFTATAAQADEFLRLRPGTGNRFGRALLQYLSSAGTVQRIPEVETETAAPVNAQAPGVLGISAAELSRIAAWLAARPSGIFVLGARVLRQPGAQIWPQLAAALGWLTQAAAGWYPLATGLPPLAGLPEPAPWPTTSELQDLGALIVSDHALLSLYPEIDPRTFKPWLIHYGAFADVTVNLAQVSLPAALWLEKEGPSCSNDRLWQWGRQLVPPPPACLSGWDFWRELATRFGWQDHFPTAVQKQEEYWQQLLRAAPYTSGVDLATLRAGGPPQSWPSDFKSFREAIIAGTAALALPQEFPKPPELASPEYPFLWLTLETAGGPESEQLASDRPEAPPWIQLHPQTAAALGIQHGELVEIIWAAGRSCGRAGLSRMVPEWLVAAPWSPGAREVLVCKAGQDPEMVRRLMQELGV